MYLETALNAFGAARQTIASSSGPSADGLSTRCSEMQHRTKKENKWWAWSGELDDLRRIGSVFRDLVAQRGSTILNEFDRGREDSADPSVASHERRKTEFSEKWRASASLHDGDDQIDGSIAEVLDELDRRSATRLEFSSTGMYAAAAGEELRVVFSRSSYIQAVHLKVRSGDQGWARQVLTLLSEEIEKGVPKWAWCRSLWGRILISLVVTVCLVSALFLLPPLLTSIPRAVIASGIILTVQIVVSSPGVVRWFFPPFEVTSQAGSSGGRRLAVLGVVLLSVPIGIIVNLLTS